VDVSEWVGTLRDEGNEVFPFAEAIVSGIEEILGTSRCPLGETSGAAMLAVLADGRVIDEFEGEVIQIGENRWLPSTTFFSVEGQTSSLPRTMKSYPEHGGKRDLDKYSSPFSGNQIRYCKDAECPGEARGNV
jgi:hypothetical protein